MGAIPTQRETVSCASGAHAHTAEASAQECARAHAVLLGSPLAPGAARAAVRAALADWAALGLPGTARLTEHLIADALAVVSELVTNAVVHAGTDVEVGCRLEETGALVVEATDYHPSRAPRDDGDDGTPHETPEYGRGLRLVAALSEEWGITYRPGTKTVWARLPVAGSEVAEQIEAYAGGRALRHTDFPVAEASGEMVGDPGDLGGVGGSGAWGGMGEPGGPKGADGPDGREGPGGPRVSDNGADGWGAAEGSEGTDVADGSDGPSGSKDPEETEGTEGTEGCDGSDGPGASRGPGGPEGAEGCDGSGRTSGLGGTGRSSGKSGSGGPGGVEVSGRADRSGGTDGPAEPGRAADPGQWDLPPWPDWRDHAAGTGSRDDPAGTGRRGVRDREWLGRGALSFLAEASDLLAGQLDEDLVASLTGQLIVPRLADWCGVWLEDESLGRGAWSDDPGAAVGARLARVWHASESQVEELRLALEKNPPRPREAWRSGPAAHPWPGDALGRRDVHGAALAYRLVAGGRPLGTLVIGRSGVPRFPEEISGLVEDLSRRVALAIGAARQYARQATISAVLQRGLLPGAVAEIPGVRSALVYESCDKGGPSGDFYDLFPAGDGRWCFTVGDVQGKGPEAAVVIGLARPWLRLLAREQYGVPDVLDRLNQLLLDDATEAADAAARALAAVGGRPVAPGDGPQTRFLSLLYGELVPFDGGVRCTLASAGHPLPLLLSPDGTVRTVAQPQTLLGVIEDATYTSETFELRSGETLLCVTDGVTERRSGSRQFDDGDGLAAALAGCAGLDADLVAERISRLVHEFGPRPPEDDLALLVLQAE
ncbi:SpoIIE family protein phosphatase [Streptomyces lancefieldiae]|uniref:SpoIIE family protein phosphatase n=1 Tax=Streptomyces lancefieldiae TaxID=3075520 RepID=A0ABU3AQH3_9ACTN|nr:SpoIIE family protein phosphatase [Streptomyces sp. DSM 40712]MDT0612442.1 SpoIIE family protein phosphatase [Streptomyces sp. DSM 40712]